MKRIFLFFIVSLCVQCNQSGNHSVTKSNEDKKVSERISVAYNQAEEQSLELSDLADSIEYVPLEMTKSSAIKYINRLTVTKHRILVQDGCRFLLFSRQGKFICHVGSKGGGPGEFICGICHDVDETNERIYIWGVYENRLFVYDFTGKFLENIQIKKASGIGIFFFLDRQHIVAVKDRPMFVADTTCLIDMVTGESRIFPGYICGIDRKKQGVYLRSATPDNNCDSVFLITKDSIILRHVIFQKKPEGKDFFMAQLPFTTDNKYLILGNRQQEPCKYDAEWYHTTKSGRIVHYTQTKSYPKQPAIYDVMEEKFCILERDGEIQGIPNDIDGGLPFIPRSDFIGMALPEISAENQMVTFYNADAMIEYRQKKKSRDIDVKNKPAQQRFDSLVEGLEEEDNPVIMIIKLKHSEL
jgi:hypothetical protein